MTVGPPTADLHRASTMNRTEPPTGGRNKKHHTQKSTNTTLYMLYMFGLLISKSKQCDAQLYRSYLWLCKSFLSFLLQHFYLLASTGFTHLDLTHPAEALCTDVLQGLICTLSEPHQDSQSLVLDPVSHYLRLYALVYCPTEPSSPPFPPSLGSCECWSRFSSRACTV